ncbi:MAG: lysophospholipid acyltransferase family protein [Halioglobus sp.]
MAAFDKDNQPLDTNGLEQHIATALATPEPSGLRLEISYGIVRRMFKPVISGGERIPDKPCLFVGNHSLFALDGAVLAPVLLKEYGRWVRGLGDRFLFANDSVADFVIQLGGVIGHPEVCSAMMENQRDLLVFPGGAHEAVKSAEDMYALQWKERYGFIKLAAKHGYTIMPFGLVGPDEFYGHLIEGHELPDSMLGKVLSRMGILTDDTRSDMMPPIPVGSLGSLIPKPQRCYLGFGEPVDLSAFEGKKLTKPKLKSLRKQVSDEIEEQLASLLLLREQRRGNDGLLRRILTL